LSGFFSASGWGCSTGQTHIAFTLCQTLLAVELPFR